MVMECKGREMTGKIGEKGSIEKKEHHLQRVTLITTTPLSASLTFSIHKVFG